MTVTTNSDCFLLLLLLMHAGASLCKVLGAVSSLESSGQDKS
jgi:hypothetical protein